MLVVIGSRANRAQSRDKFFGRVGRKGIVAERLLLTSFPSRPKSQRKIHAVFGDFPSRFFDRATLGRVFIENGIGVVDMSIDFSTRRSLSRARLPSGPEIGT